MDAPQRQRLDGLVSVFLVGLVVAVEVAWLIAIAVVFFHFA